MLIKMFNNSINRQEGFTFIEIVISMIILSVLISTIIHYHSSSGASSNQIYDLKAVNVLQSEANKLMAFYEIGSDDGEFEALGVGVSPPDNIFLFHGNTMTEALHETIHRKTGVSFEEFDLFYTYLTMYEEFSRLIVRKAKKGAVFMVYGLEKILPKVKGLRLLTPETPIEGILALYQKE